MEWCPGVHRCVWCAIGDGGNNSSEMPQPLLPIQTPKGKLLILVMLTWPRNSHMKVSLATGEEAEQAKAGEGVGQSKREQSLLLRQKLIMCPRLSLNLKSSCPSSSRAVNAGKCYCKPGENSCIQTQSGTRAQDWKQKMKGLQRGANEMKFMCSFITLAEIWVKSKIICKDDIFYFKTV